MANNSNTIEINGKRYDAITGKQLSGISAHAVHSNAPAKGKYVDGFHRVSKSAAGGTTVLKPLPKKAVKTPAKVSTPRVRATAKHAAAHKPQPAKTLMRSVVKKPLITAPSVIKAQARTDILATIPQHTITPKLSQHLINPQRQKKAAQMIKSPQIARYAPATTVKAIAQPANSLHAAVRRPARHSIDAIQTSLQHAKSAKAVPVIPVVPTRATAPKKDIFAEALANATSHENVHHTKKAASSRRKRLSGVLSIAVCLLVIAGFLAYVNTPALTMRVASTKAGFSAKLPNYSPAGFNFGNLSYGPGNVTVSYKDKADTDRSYNITQRASNWDSQALLSNFVATANKAYQTYQQAGRTVYLYGNNTATWVDSGVWYTVDGNSALSTNQILNLASSL